MSPDKPRVLVAEDNPALANVTRFNLERAGFDVSVARDGNEAAQLIDEQPFDLVLTDLQMPGMDGEQLCSHIRSRPEGAQLPIVVCSAKGLEVDMTRLVMEFRVAHMLYKPFSPVELVGICEREIRKAAEERRESRLAESPA